MKLQQKLWAAINEKGQIASCPEGNFISEEKDTVKFMLDVWGKISKDGYKGYKIVPVKIIHL